MISNCMMHMILVWKLEVLSKGPYLRPVHCTRCARSQGSKLTLANSQNASDFGNLRVRKISTGKPLRVRIIHVSQAFGESCSNVWTISEANKQRSLSWEEHVFVSHCQRYCTEALCQTFAFACCCCSSWFWSYHFHYTRYEIWSLTFQRERICSWSHQFASGKKSY